MAESFFKRALADPYLMQVPSQRPEVRPTPGLPPGREAPVAPLKTAVVARLRKQYPDLEDLDDDSLLTGVHRVAVEDKLLPAESTVDDLMRAYRKGGIVIRAGQPAATGTKVSAEQLNVPVIDDQVPSKRVWADLVQKHWPELADLPAEDVLRGMYKEKTKAKKLPEGTKFDDFLKSLVGDPVATAKGVPGKTVRDVAIGLVEPFLAPTEAALGAIAAGAEETPEAMALREQATSALGRGLGAFAGVPIGAKEQLGVEAIVKAGGTARALIAQQMKSNAKAVGIFNALTTAGEEAPRVAAGDETVAKALLRVGISTGVGAAAGAVLGPTLGAVSHPARVAARNEAAQALAAEEAKLLRKKAIEAFTNDLRPMELNTRFGDDMNSGGSTEEIGRSILAKVLNVDPASVPEDMLVPMVAKIEQFRADQEKIAAGLASKVYPELPTTQGPSTVPNIAQPPGAPLFAEGGRAPEPGLPPSIQGPLGERTTLSTQRQGAVEVPEPGLLPPETAVPGTPRVVSPAIEPGPVTPEPGLVPGIQGPISEPTALSTQRPVTGEVPEPGLITVAPGVSLPPSIVEALIKAGILAPEPGLVPAVQGPIGERAPRFKPPEKVKRTKTTKRGE